MTTRIRVRIAATGDAAAMQGLFDVLGYPAEVPAIKRRLTRLHADGAYEAWVAIEHRTIIGFAAGHLLFPLEDDQPAAQLIALATATAYQGAGAGSALCSEFERWAREHGAARLLVNSGTHRIASHGFYERRGYSRTGIRFGKSLVRD